MNGRGRFAAAPAEKATQAEAAGKSVPLPPAEPATPEAQAQTHVTDPDPRIRRHSGKALIPGDNAQVAVYADSPIMVAATMTQPAADSPHLLGVLDQVRANNGRTPRGVLADAGYGREKNRDGSRRGTFPRRSRRRS